MANKRTIDPTANEAGSHIIGLRVTNSQIDQIRTLCEKRGVARSVLLRELVRQAFDQEITASPDPF